MNLDSKLATVILYMYINFFFIIKWYNSYLMYLQIIQTQTM